MSILRRRVRVTVRRIGSCRYEPEWGAERQRATVDAETADDAREKLLSWIEEILVDVPHRVREVRP